MFLISANFLKTKLKNASFRCALTSFLFTYYQSKYSCYCNKARVNSRANYCWFKNRNIHFPLNLVKTHRQSTFLKLSVMANHEMLWIYSVFCRVNPDKQFLVFKLAKHIFRLKGKTTIKRLCVTKRKANLWKSIKPKMLIL